VTQTPAPGGSPSPRRLVGVVDDYAKELDKLEARSVRNTIATIRRSFQTVLTDLRRHYSAYVEALGPVGYDPSRNTIRRPGEYSAVEATTKYRAILADAALFLPESEISQWQVRYEQDLREAARLGGDLGQQLLTLAGRPIEAGMFSGADPASVRAAANTTAALIRGEGAKFRDQLVQIVGEGATRGWGPSRLELQIRQALRGAKDPQGLTQRMGLEQRAALIARAELANAYAQGSFARARARGDAYVRVLTSKDERVCRTCASRNGRIYPVDRLVLPFHPRCRCVPTSIPNEAVEERDPATRRILLDAERWQEEHNEGLQTFAQGQYDRDLQGLRRQRDRLKDPELLEQIEKRIARMEEKGPDLVKARLELAKALRTPTASEKRIFGPGAQALSESVGLFD
jgi:SPP1 gp7 family putative phage head morphogenesis protein